MCLCAVQTFGKVGEEMGGLATRKRRGACEEGVLKMYQLGTKEHARRKRSSLAPSIRSFEVEA